MSSRTTPPRPVDVEVLFPALADHRRTTTRLHPRPGSPTVRDSSVGGPLLWPADEPWPMCTEPHKRDSGRRPENIRRYRRVLAAAWARTPAPGERPGPTDEERELLTELQRRHRVPDLPDTAPIPMIGLAQLYRRDIPDLTAGPADRDLLQLFWCPFDAHSAPGGLLHGMSLRLHWRDSGAVTDATAVLDTPQPEPEVVGFDGYVPEPCVLHPEQVTEYPYADLLPPDLRDAIDEWDADGDLYQYDLSITEGWKVGGYASWHLTDPYPMNCADCATPMELLLAIDSYEWDGRESSWTPMEDRGVTLPMRDVKTPTQVMVGRTGTGYVFICPTDPVAHPHRISVQ
ncbi:hypothetical protein Sipo8835_21180 [Streptomyces ipomoeae]|uniref:DUF1963 domain-containing protein n=1 Tax=Streptomyces ipomoeae TaxID=103232 RepID=A0AAE8W3W1_9ACTN|nr:hypothetical protein [Streptomyces ipomoeae]TQE32177.1 hypothetical protein Sipo8835_21180 [Streptomyces ipomoeae]